MKSTIFSALLSHILILSTAHFVTSHHDNDPNHHHHYSLSDHGHDLDDIQLPLLSADLPDPVAPEIRNHWMRRAKEALLELSGTPCPVQAFGTAIVNHTTLANDGLGELVCIGANQVIPVGNPTLHGEVSAINNCTNILASPPYNLSPAEIRAAWRDLSLYTTAEACTMCTSAISWGGFREYIYATTIWTLIDLGWKQVPITSRELLSRSPMAKGMRIIGPVLEEETDELFGWQFKKGGPCPLGCKSGGDDGGCVYDGQY